MSPKRHDLPSPSPKRRKLYNATSIESRVGFASDLNSLRRSVSPPHLKRTPAPNVGSLALPVATQNENSTSLSSANDCSSTAFSSSIPSTPRLIPSPVQINRVSDLESESNVDAIGLRDIIGDPLIKECWQFNYLYDLDFLMQTIDRDIRHLVQVKVVHGSWKRDDQNRQRLEEASKRYPNVQLITAHMPEPFGTHHSKMMCIFRHDDTVEIVIHTANMIRRDWDIMCQAIWRSPRLPLYAQNNNYKPSQKQMDIGGGERFKKDFLRYLGAYNDSSRNRTSNLIGALRQYNFAEIRAALVASVPCKQKSEVVFSDTSWGSHRLKDVLKSVSSSTWETKPTIVIQISSIASLGQDITWFENFSRILSTGGGHTLTSTSSTARVIFPTAAEIQRSVGGYESGGSIHMKTTTAAQLKQLNYLKPFLCHWSGENVTLSDNWDQSYHQPVRKAGRGRAAPHIKTYIRFSDNCLQKIDWAMITSANLSKQAWGTVPNKDGEARICSWELGVVFWPALFTDNPEEHVIMVPTFKADSPATNKPPDQKAKVMVGFRMPYDLPLVPYNSNEMPWCATITHAEPDWKGQVWQV